MTGTNKGAMNFFKDRINADYSTMQTCTQGGQTFWGAADCDKAITTYKAEFCTVTPCYSTLADANKTENIKCFTGDKATGAAKTGNALGKCGLRTLANGLSQWVDAANITCTNPVDNKLSEFTDKCVFVGGKW